MSKGVLRKKIPMPREALRGRFRDHHAVMLRIVFDDVAHLETAIGNLDTEINRVMAPFTTARDRLDTQSGRPH